MQIKLFASFILMPILFSACASMLPETTKEVPQATSGERMLMESKGMAQLGERWLEGQKKIKQGEDLVRDGQLKIQDGRRLMAEGGLIQKEAEDNYKNIKKQAVPSGLTESIGNPSAPVITPLGR